MLAPDEIPTLAQIRYENSQHIYKTTKHSAVVDDDPTNNIIPVAWNREHLNKLIPEQQTMMLLDKAKIIAHDLMQEVEAYASKIDLKQVSPPFEYIFKVPVGVYDTLENVYEICTMICQSMANPKFKRGVNALIPEFDELLKPPGRDRKFIPILIQWRFANK